MRGCSRERDAARKSRKHRGEQWACTPRARTPSVAADRLIVAGGILMHYGVPQHRKIQERGTACTLHLGEREPSIDDAQLGDKTQDAAWRQLLGNSKDFLCRPDYDEG
jgi:hypothetical protein